MFMPATFVKEAKMTLGERVQAKSWVTVGPGPDQFGGTRLQTQLLFNEAIPANPYNRATRVGRPAAIVIERLKPRGEEREDVDSTRSSIRFLALSEERLLAAVRLAKRDLRRKQQESLTNSPIRPQQPKNSPPNKCTDDLPQRMGSWEGRSKATGSREEMTRGEAKVLVYTPQKLSVPPRPDHDQSPPTRDPGQGQTSSSQEPKLSQEIRRLQRELAIYIQRIEQLANRDGMAEEPLEPDEQRRVEVRRQEQAARSARIIYVLQQQVKEIQEDIEKLRSQKIRHTKKSSAMDRLAAAHRGAVRAMQVFTSQLSGPSEGRVPSHYKELGQLIRQLSLCSAKVEVGQGSAVPETALDILQKLETLDSALSKQERRQAQARSSPPARQHSPHRSKSPPRAARGPATRGLRGARRAAGTKRSLPGRRVLQPLRSSQPPPGQPQDRSQVLRAGLESLVQQRELREGAQKPGAHVRDTGFQQPTVASRLRVNQPPQREASVPWIPTSPHSPPQHRSPHRTRPEPRCLFSPLKPSCSSPTPPEQQQQQQEETVGLAAGQGLTTDKKRQAQSEALRQAWLDRMTMQRLRELDQLSKEEAERIQGLRANMGSPTQWAEGAEQEARGRLKPLLDQAQQTGETWDRKRSSLRHRRSDQAADAAAESAERLSEALLEETERAAETDGEAGPLTEEQAQRRLRLPTLESMLLRMEEMEKDQEAVRRRIATISYSDPYYWDREETTGTQQPAAGSRPAFPQAISLTKPALRHTPTADIFLEKPVETGVLSDASFMEEGPGTQGEDAASSSPAALGERSGGTRLSVSASMLRSVQQYKEDREAYLRLVAHEAVGSFNPWAITDSLAEELMSEALADVAAEFQDMCEEYAEAVFTSEFLQPIRSPPASIPPLASQ